MSAKKRANEHAQMSKEEYERMMNSGGSSRLRNPLTNTFDRAENLADRRLLRVGASHQRDGGSLANNRPPLANPFAKVNLAASSAAAPVTTTSTDDLALEIGDFVKFVSTAKGTMNRDDLGAVIAAIRDQRGMQRHNLELSKKATTSAAAPKETKTVLSSSATFGAPPAVVPPVTAAFAPAASSSDSKPKFSFGNFPTVAAAPPPATQPTQGGGGDVDNDINEDGDGGDDPKPAAEDPNFDTVHQYDKVRVYCLKDPKVGTSGWVPLGGVGYLKLQSSTPASGLNKKRIVVRLEASAKVIFNTFIDASTKFTLTEVPPKKPNGTKTGTIQFAGTNDPDRGYEAFLIRTIWPDAQDLHSNVQALVK